MKPKVTIVMPAYNAAETLAMTYRAIPPGIADEILVVDDASRDDTVGTAKALGIPIIRHPHNVGYGRAARIIDMMEAEGVVGPGDGAKPREVLVRPEMLAPAGDEAVD